MLFALILSMATQAQGILGTVTDDLGEPVIGASVVEKGNAQNGTITNIDGQFTIKVNEGTPLIISYIGYLTQEVKASRNMTVVMKEDAQTLQDVVVIGYGVQKKSVVTASIAKVSADDLDGKTRLRAEDALKGMAAGVQVTSSSGQPGSKSMIRIRGIGTINSSEPLYIIDGMPTDQNGMESVNPNDIESIEVLKATGLFAQLPQLAVYHHVDAEGAARGNFEGHVVDNAAVLFVGEADVFELDGPPYGVF